LVAGRSIIWLGNTLRRPGRGSRLRKGSRGIDPSFVNRVNIVNHFIDLFLLIYSGGSLEEYFSAVVCFAFASGVS
jgi:hypothetical protein